MNRRTLIGLGTAAIAAGLTGCQASREPAAAPSAATRQLDTAHGPVAAPIAPQRVVAVSFDAPFQLLAVGVTPVGAFDYSALYDQYPAEQVTALKKITSIGRWGEPDLDAVAALRPDLIVGVGEELDDAVYTKLAALAPTALFAQKSRADWESVATAIADAAGAASALGSGRTSYQELLASLKSTYAPVFTGQRWVHYSFGDAEGQFSVQFPTGVTGAVLQQLGANFADIVSTAQPEAGYKSYSIEQADLLEDATVGLHPLDSKGQEYAGLATTQKAGVWKKLPFVINKRDFGLMQLTGINTYPAGVSALRELEEAVLKPLATG